MQTDYEITATNSIRTVEGAHSAVFGIIKELTKLEEQNQIITKIKVEVETIDGSLKSIETSEICPINSDHDNVIKLYAKFGKPVDTAGNTSRNTVYKHTMPDDSFKEILRFMDRYTNTEASYYIGWMTSKEFHQFGNEFNALITKLFNEPIFEEDQEYEIDEWDLKNAITKTFNKYKLEYHVRKVPSSRKPFIIDKNED